jgi:deoxyribodipyrimidine photo-lyase
VDRFAAGPIYSYDTARNSLSADPFAAGSPVETSGLSPYLRFGMLSPRQAYRAARDALETAPGEQARQSVITWINELIWREFYMHILYHFPHVDRVISGLNTTRCPGVMHRTTCKPGKRDKPGIRSLMPPCDN